MTAVEKEQGCRSGGTKAKPPWLGQERIPGGIEHGLIASGKDAMAEPPLAEVGPDPLDLRACRSLQDKVEELEAKGFEGRTVAKVLAAVAAEQLHQVGGPEALAAWAEVLSSWSSEAGSAQ